MTILLVLLSIVAYIIFGMLTVYLLSRARLLEDEDMALIVGTVWPIILPMFVVIFLFGWIGILFTWASNKGYYR